MTARRKSPDETTEWVVATPRAAALVSPRVAARVVRHLEDALSVLDLTGCVAARARGIVGSLERAD